MLIFQVSLRMIYYCIDGIFWFHFVNILSLIKNQYNYPILELVKKSQN